MKFVVLFCFQNVILSVNRLQDVRATEIDKVDMLSSFRPGDIVRAHVVSFVWNSPVNITLKRLAFHRYC